MYFETSVVLSLSKCREAHVLQQKYIALAEQETQLNEDIIES